MNQTFSVETEMLLDPSLIEPFTIEAREGRAAMQLGISVNTKSVLIVEDDDSIARLLQVMLERNGFEATIAPTCAHARQLFECDRPDLMLLDINLPDGDGLDVLHWVRETQRSMVPVVILTAFSQEAKTVRAYELGAADFLVKPFRSKELLARVGHLLGRP